MFDAVTAPLNDTPSKEATAASSLSAVKEWTERIRNARAQWDQEAFNRMRKDMEFAAGFQWQEQAALEEDRYVANFTLRLINQKVAALYARNPKVAAQRKKRLDFQIWDGRMESLQQAVALSATPGASPEDVLAAQALLADYRDGRARRDIVDKVGQTLEILYSYYQNNQMPSFKKQMKQLVRRTAICGVGYVRLGFDRDYEASLATSSTSSPLANRIKCMQHILMQLATGQIQPEDPKVEELQALSASIQQSMSDGETVDVIEQLVFDFPCATSIIPDRACRNIKDFVGAQWVAQEYLFDRDFINGYFEVNIGMDQGCVEYQSDGRPSETSTIVNADPTSQPVDKPRLCVWEVWNLKDKSTFFICDGYKDFLVKPQPAEPVTQHFWPWFSLTFNDIECEPGKQKASPFPPSDVQICRSAQKEWNRTRNELRGQRKANAPMYFTHKGVLTQNDMERVRDAEPNSVIQLEGVPRETDISKVIGRLETIALDPNMYDTAPLQQDLMSVMGNEEGSQPASSKATATAASINEQARLVVTSSNVDDLDDLLSDLAEAGGQILLRELSIETVQRIVGPGAVWPEFEKENFINYIYLDVVAASSGRPNRALEIANFQQLAPILLQSGANPHFILREGLKRLDDRLEADEAFPMGPSGQMSPIASMTPTAGQPAAPQRGVNAPSPGGQFPGQTVPRPALPSGA